MKNRFLNISKLALAILAFCTQANADSFLVQDQQGLPLKNVVLEFTVNTTSTSVVRGPKTLIMDQVDKLFKPNVLVIHQGDFVDFPNSDNIRHHVYSFSSVNPFELKLYSGRPEAPLQFNNAGVAVLGCNIHDSMVGYIYIATSKYVLMTDEQGLATLDATVKYESVNVWHASALTSIKNITYDDITQKANDNALFVIDLVVQSPEPRNTFQSIFNQNGE
mgnify:CR=1 FL=1|tara:strand:- start:7262 stop:7921 length:660 start_codon:yes stop_codon:yes gene_type:complete